MSHPVEFTQPQPPYPTNPHPGYQHAGFPPNYGVQPSHVPLQVRRNRAATGSLSLSLVIALVPVALAAGIAILYISWPAAATASLKSGQRSICGGNRCWECLEGD